MIIGENKPMHKKCNIQIKYTKSVLWTSSVTGRSKLTRSSLGVGIAMWRGSTLMVEEPV